MLKEVCFNIENQHGSTNICFLLGSRENGVSPLGRSCSRIWGCWYIHWLQLLRCSPLFQAMFRARISHSSKRNSAKKFLKGPFSLHPLSHPSGSLETPLFPRRHLHWKAICSMYVNRCKSKVYIYGQSTSFGFRLWSKLMKSWPRSKMAFGGPYSKLPMVPRLRQLWKLFSMDLILKCWRRPACA